MRVKPNERLLYLKRKLEPFRGVFLFITIVLIAHLSWKISFHTGIENQEYSNKILTKNSSSSVITNIKGKVWHGIGAGDVDSKNTDCRYISFFNNNLTAKFVPWTEKTALASFWVVNLVCRQPLCLLNYVDSSSSKKIESRTLLSYDRLHGPTINIIWGCTGVKQLYILLLVILFSRGIWWKRFIYFLLGSFVLLLFNVMRISIITLLIKSNPESFEILHDVLFKYLFYGLIFLLWILWEEKFSGKNVIK
jgi:Transmembrane exosortase (Exosortase_EpsH).